MQTENDRLKKAPGVVSNEELDSLRNENVGLKTQLEELRLTMGAKLAERYDAKDRGTQKLMNDYDRLRRDYQAETEANERFRNESRKVRTNAAIVYSENKKQVYWQFLFL